MVVSLTPWPLVAQVGSSGAVTVVGLLVLVIAVVTAYRSVVTVGAGEVKALYVFGEFQAILGSGINVVPPFVSSVHPVDPRTETIDLGDRRVDVPPEGRAALSDHADRADTDGDRFGSREE